METTTIDESDYDDGYIQMTLALQIPSGIGLVILILIGICGNSMAIAAYIQHRGPTSTYDFFIFNLACTDLFICCSSMPFYAVYTILDYTWYFGYVYCKIWSVIDFTLCFESIVLMLLLSLDRLFIITMGSKYIKRMTKPVTRVTVAISWLISFSVYGPAIIGWNHWVGYSTVKYMDCDVEFSNVFWFTTMTAMMEFILPFIFLSALNATIFYKVRQLSKVKPLDEALTRTQTLHKSDVCQEERRDATNTEEVNQSNPEGHGDKDNLNIDRSPRPSSDLMSKSDKWKCDRTAEKEAEEVAKRHLVKAAKFLATLVIAFLVFWAPYTITTVIISFCKECVNPSLWQFFNWLLWMKSAANPFLYAFNSLRYRQHFIKYVTFNHKLCKGYIKDTSRTARTTSTHAYVI